MLSSSHFVEKNFLEQTYLYDIYAVRGTKCVRVQSDANTTNKLYLTSISNATSNEYFHVNK